MKIGIKWLRNKKQKRSHGLISLKPWTSVSSLTIIANKNKLLHLYIQQKKRKGNDRKGGTYALLRLCHNNYRYLI